MHTLLSISLVMVFSSALTLFLLAPYTNPWSGSYNFAERLAIGFIVIFVFGILLLIDAAAFDIWWCS